MSYKDADQQRAYQREWLAARRAEWLHEHGPCIDCGTWNDLQVDHADAATKVSHRVWSWAEPRRLAELAKCVVRCERCHVRKSFPETRHLGEQNAFAKLTESDVRAIRASSSPPRVLAARFSVDRTLIWQIRTRKIWQHI